MAQKQPNYKPQKWGQNFSLSLSSLGKLGKFARSRLLLSAVLLYIALVRFGFGFGWAYFGAPRALLLGFRARKQTNESRKSRSSIIS